MQAGCSERLIIQEFRACTQRLRKGILVQPSITNINQWQVNFMPHEGFFKDQILTCMIVFENFPSAVPKVIFQPETLHPMIDPATNQFDCREMFSEWSVSMRVYNLINFVYDSFLDISIPVNQAVPDQEAAYLLKQGGPTFQSKATKILHAPPDPAERSELNVPKRWGNQKERVAHILVAIGSH
ncbi:Ubiquitin-conjugating enzyme family protein [Tritrichomonas foetus]|uniref:Ubiquitin-conjugating enzyme family protein n=1 Tax=Tritrichomonas foetus TaxID=1144522 RepID=A0A1J4JFQ9_9EUKA|nr:Ubiquitin-conjugating enzyme family protein [Tritrichomonas foetus]|eukprot:OHS96475.1 Ubiquitin-conjugating enzyme family protein [Tritrichomonas foetus]